MTPDNRSGMSSGEKWILDIIIMLISCTQKQYFTVHGSESPRENVIEKTNVNGIMDGREKSFSFDSLDETIHIKH